MRVAGGRALGFDRSHPPPGPGAYPPPDREKARTQAGFFVPLSARCVTRGAGRVFVVPVKGHEHSNCVSLLSACNPCFAKLIRRFLTVNNSFGVA